MESQTAFSLYIHLPYCIKKCPYCDFNVHVVSQIPEEDYAHALVQELEYYARTEAWARRPLKSVYFGGGTPSLFKPSSIETILITACALFRFDPNIEISLEANPGTEDARNFPGYRSCGVNRLSLGIQSFQPHLLKFLGRIHSSEESKQTLDQVRRSGFDNFSLDLIYGSSGQSFSDLKADLQIALSFDPSHVSAYNLTIEEGTPFHRAFRAGKLCRLEEETEIIMAELIIETLSHAGIERYEISNYAKAGHESRHNINYWEGGDYLGLGAGAHSHARVAGDSIFSERWWNEKNPGRYMERVMRHGQAVAAKDSGDLEKAAGESLFLGLRRVKGINKDHFKRRFGKNPEELYSKIQDFLRDGLMVEENGRLRLSRRGLMVADSIFVSFV